MTKHIWYMFVYMKAFSPSKSNSTSSSFFFKLTRRWLNKIYWFSKLEICNLDKEIQYVSFVGLMIYWNDGCDFSAVYEIQKDDVFDHSLMLLGASYESGICLFFFFFLLYLGRVHISRKSNFLHSIFIFVFDEATANCYCLFTIGNRLVTSRQVFIVVYYVVSEF